MALTEMQLLIAHGYLPVAGERSFAADLSHLSQNRGLITVVSNFNYYGFMPSVDTLRRLLILSHEELTAFWRMVEPALRELTGANREMDKYVVYRNFPKEVLEMAQAEYWCKQILMYWGFGRENFAQETAERLPLMEQTKLKVLHLADEGTPAKIFEALTENKTRWTDDQLAHAQFLSARLNIAALAVEQVAFRENGIRLISHLMDINPQADITVNDATDVVRLAALRSEADVSLRTTVKFRKFKKGERRFLCRLLENSKHLEADMAERPSIFKLLLAGLHPGDFACHKLQAAYDKLYKGELVSFASRVEAGIATVDGGVLTLLQSRPGDFTRRFHKLYSVFGESAVVRYIPVMEKLSNHQLVKLVRYLETINTRKNLTFPPKGNWSRLQIAENKKKPIDEVTIAAVKTRAGTLICNRLRDLVPEGFDVDADVSRVKLQTSDQELASYGRGTIFDIPAEMTFLRTASYWENDRRQGATWFDNGWNFFDAEWNHLGACCWNANSFGKGGNVDWGSYTANPNAAAIYAGDPVNTHEMKGRACEMIDLYLDRLRDAGVRYAVWNILSYNKKPFDEATGEVLATLQWGEHPTEGKLYEPGRAQMVFPLKGKSLTKYIAYIDVQKRQLIYLDANLKGSVRSANSNGEKLSKTMPAFLEYLATLPTVADLLAMADKGTVPVVYSDKGLPLQDGRLAYVFRPEQEDNNFKSLDIEKLL